LLFHHARLESFQKSRRRAIAEVVLECADATRPRGHAIDSAAYRTELFAGSSLGHCGPPALAMPITLMTAPSVITPRSANPLRKAKQPSGTATASNKSRFMTKCVCLWLRPPSNSSRLAVRTTPSKKFRNERKCNAQRNITERLPPDWASSIA